MGRPSARPPACRMVWTCVLVGAVAVGVCALTSGVGLLFTGFASCVGLVFQVVFGRFGGSVVSSFLKVVCDVLGIGLDIVGSLLLRAVVAGGESTEANCDCKNGRDLHRYSPVVAESPSLGL